MPSERRGFPSRSDVWRCRFLAGVCSAARRDSWRRIRRGAIDAEGPDCRRPAAATHPFFRPIRLAAALAAAPLAGCSGVLDPAGRSAPAAAHLVEFAGDHAGDRHAGDRRDARRSPGGSAPPTPAPSIGRMGVLRPARADRLGDPGAGRRVPRRHRLVRLA